VKHVDGFIAEIDNVSKSFGGIRALNGVHFDLKAGEVHALLGENGAGKSTLMKILSGAYSKDEGTVRVMGRSVENLTPKKAQKLGIAIIHQELNMCAHLTVAENIFLGRERKKGLTLDNRSMEEETRRILRNFNIDIEPDTIVGSLAVSKQQMVEIAKALSTNCKILIMDEPTSALTASEIEELFRLIRRLRDEGCGIVYISHRLEELQHIVDRVTVLRDGHYISTCCFADLTLPEIISMMVGRDIKEKFPRVECERGRKIFEVNNLNAGRLVRNINLELYEGEIVGIAGLMGAGRTEMTRAIFGVEAKQSGEIILDGKRLNIRRPSDAINAGLVLVPEDRKKDGLCLKLSVRENIALPNLSLISGAIKTVNRRKERAMAVKGVSDLRIRAKTIDDEVASLSGGNQQKVVVGKWLARNAKVVMFDEPTRGIDVGAKVDIYNLMNELKQRGIGVMFVSSELPEILGISDRIVVMCDGRITGEMPRDEATQDKIMEYAVKFEAKLDEGVSGQGEG